MGELLRSANAKRIVNQHQVILRSKALRMHQWGISLLGAREGLCHWRGTIEPMVANGTLEPLVGRPTWILSTCSATPSGRVSARLSARTFWKPRPGPSGSAKLSPSPLSPLVPPSPPNGELSRATCSPPSKAPWSNPLDAKGVCDEWFVDDGQVFVGPFSLDPLLRALDAALASFGATRGVVCGARQRQEVRASALPT